MIRKIINGILKSREFNAEKCRIHQQNEIERRAKEMIDNIQCFINSKIENPNEIAVIYSLTRPEENNVYKIVEESFKNKGFIVFRTKFQELGDLEFLVISWISNNT